MLQIGLTGGIGTGKSLVAQRLQELGAVLIDADIVAREVVAPGSEGLAEVAAAFGAEVVAADGSLNRALLGQRIFADTAQRERLNAIIHPRVRQRSAELRAQAAEGAVVVEDIPLLVETGQAERFDLVVVVDATEEQQLERLVEHRGMNAAEAQQRIASQASRRQRLRYADLVIDNTGTPEETLAQVDRMWQEHILPRRR